MGHDEYGGGGEGEGEGGAAAEPLRLTCVRSLCRDGNGGDLGGVDRWIDQPPPLSPRVVVSIHDCVFTLLAIPHPPSYLIDTGSTATTTRWASTITRCCPPTHKNCDRVRVGLCCGCYRRLVKGGKEPRCGFEMRKHAKGHQRKISKERRSRAQTYTLLDFLCFFARTPLSDIFALLFTCSCTSSPHLPSPLAHAQTHNHATPPVET